MDKVRPITVEIALNKAYTATSFQQPTQELTAVAGQSWFQSLVVSSNGRIMPGAGALPVVEGGNVVGAIAVSGGTEDQDHGGRQQERGDATCWTPRTWSASTSSSTST